MITTVAIALGDAAVMIMEAAPVGHVMPDPKPPRPLLAQQPPRRPETGLS